MKTVTLSTLVADTGEPVRTIQYWTDQGVLRPVRSTNKKGRGVRRYYAAEPMYGERKYALLASALQSKLHMPVDDLKNLIAAERLMYDPVETLRADPKHIEAALRNRAERDEDQKKNEGFVFPFDAALAGEPNVLAVVAVRPHDPVVPYKTIYLREMYYMAGMVKRNKVLAGTPEAQAHLEKIAAQEQEARTYVNRKTDPLNAQMLMNLMADNAVAVVLNLSKIFAPLYSNPEPVEAENEAD